jgi:O-antigen/teichoic acid export membrane protein
LEQKNVKNLRTNFLSLTFGQVVSYALNFLCILIIARYLGVDNFGEFAGVLALVNVLSKIVDFGIGPIIFRELSKADGDYNDLNNAISFKLILSLIVLLFYNSIGFLFHFSLLEILLANLLYINIFISSRMANFREVLVTPFKVKLKMQSPMFLNILDGVILLILVLLIPVFHGGLLYFTVSYVVANIPGFVFLIYLLRRDFSYNFHFRYDKLKWLIYESIPLAGFVIMMIIFQQLDIILLKGLKGTYFTGIYSVAARLTSPLDIIPIAIGTSVFPIIVKNYELNNNNRKIVILVFKTLFFISFIITLLFSFKAGYLVKLIFGKEYAESYLPAILLFCSKVFLFFNLFSLNLLTIYNHQKWIFVYAIILVALNVGMNILLMPQYSYMGAGIAKLIPSVIGTIFIVLVLTKKNIPFLFYNLKTLLWILLVTIAFYIISYLNIYLYIIIASILVILSLRSLILFDYNEIVMFLRILNKEKFLPVLFLKKN